MKGLLDNVGSSSLVLEYPEERIVSTDIEQKLADFSPRSQGNKVTLCLKKTDGHTNFNDAYQAALATFGEAASVNIQDEDLEDVFLRITHENQS